MTTTQLLILFATIWVAPHANEKYAFLCSGVFLILAACIGLEWI
jgi:hypothetical protein